MRTMKKNIIYIAAALLLAGCTKDAATEVSQMTGGEPILTVSAGVSAGRTTVTTTEQGLLDIDWAEDDRIGLYATADELLTGRNISYTATPNEENASLCTFAATNEGEVLYWNGSKEQAFYAYYPFEQVIDGLPDAAAQPISLPATQEQAKGNSAAHLAKYGVMTAAPVVFEPNATLGSGICFNFTSLFSVVEFRIKTDAACPLAELPIKSLTLSAKGTALAAPVATMDLTQTPTAIATQETATELQLTFAEEIMLKRDAYTSFYMVVLPGTHAANSLQLDVTAIDNSVHAVPIAEGVTFRSNKHYVREYELTFDGFVAADPFEVELPNLTTKVGEPLTINFSGKANSIDFWSGEYGHDYAYATKERIEKAVVKMQFEVCLVNGAQREPLSVKVSTDFDGTMTEEAIKAATWTDVSAAFSIPKELGSSDTKNPREYTWTKTTIPTMCGPVDCSPWFGDASQSCYVMFHYHVNIHQESVYDEMLKKNVEYGRTFCYLYDCTVWSDPYADQPKQELYKQAFKLNTDNEKTPYIEEAPGSPTLVYGSTLDDGDGKNIAIKYSYTTSEKSYPYVLRFGANFRPTVDKDSYLVLPKITRPADQLSFDKPFVAQAAGAETPASWSYTFTEAGTYKVYVVGTITTLVGEKPVVTEATITVTE